jgi:hypothetical protein
MNKQNFIRKTILASSIAAIVGLYGCSSSDSTNDKEPVETLSTGIFIDAPVKGLEYSSASASGTTNEKGEFQYKEGEDVTFKVSGVDIGTVPGASVVPVLTLPKGRVAARLLQSIDTDALKELIDISKVVISDEEKAAVKLIIASSDLTERSTLLDAFFSESLFNIQEATKAKNPDLKELNFNSVSDDEALEHIKDSLASIAKDWTAADLNEQAYVSMDGHGAAYLFKGDATGTEYTKQAHGDHAMVHADEFTWSIAEGKLNITSNADNSVTKVSLLGPENNQYTISTIDDEGELEADSVYKAKPLDLAALDGKILSFDTSNDSDCSARTVKFMGETASLKEDCLSHGHVHSETVQLMADTDLDNVIHIMGTDDDGAYMIKVSLLEGDLNEGVFGFLHFDKNHNVTDLSIEEFEMTNAELVSEDMDMTNDDTGMDMGGTTETTGNAITGRDLYAAQGCSAAGCHTADPSAKVKNIDNGQSVTAIRSAINNVGVMSGFSSLTDAQLADIATYVKDAQCPNGGTWMVMGGMAMCM